MNILAACADHMIERARQDAPNETCGFFTGRRQDIPVAAGTGPSMAGGRRGLIESIHPMKNASAEPRIRYEFEPVEHFKTLKRMEREGTLILGVYHSHPASPAFPSATDVARATLPDGTPTYPEYLYIIVSLEFPAAPALRAFRVLPGGEIKEEGLEFVSH